MKRFLSFFIILAVMFILTSCQNNNGNYFPSSSLTLNYVGNKQMLDIFTESAEIKSILKDCKNVDLNMKMGSVSGLKKETKEDEATATSIDYYYSGETLVYAVYNGYGENTWVHYTTSKSGKNIEVHYWDEGKDFKNCKIKFEDYELFFSNVNEKYKTGAEFIYVTFKDNITYTILADGNYFVSSAYYKDETNDLHKYRYEYNFEEDGKPYEMDIVVLKSIFPDKPNEKIRSVLDAVLTAKTPMSVEILIGNHELYRNEKASAIFAETTLVFATKKQAEKFLKATDKVETFTVEENYDDGNFIVKIGKVFFPISASFDSFFEKLIYEEDVDNYYKTIEFSNTYEIIVISPGTLHFH